MTKRQYRQLSNLVADIQYNNGFERREAISAKPCVFMYFSGHVALIDIQIYKYGWMADTSPDISFTIYMDKYFDKETYDRCIHALRDIRDGLRGD